MATSGQRRMVASIIRSFDLAINPNSYINVIHWLIQHIKRHLQLCTVICGFNESDLVNVKIDWPMHM